MLEMKAGQKYLVEVHGKKIKEVLGIKPGASPPSGRVETVNIN